MGVRILAGTFDGEGDFACLVDSVTETAFGPLFRAGEIQGAEDAADDFLAYCRAHGAIDPRLMGEKTLAAQVSNWRKDLCPACETTSCGCRDCGVKCNGGPCAPSCSQADEERA